MKGWKCSIQKGNKRGAYFFQNEQEGQILPTREPISLIGGALRGLPIEIGREGK